MSVIVVTAIVNGISISISSSYKFGIRSRCNGDGIVIVVTAIVNK